MFSHLSRDRSISPGRRRRRPSLESLEGRQLMSVGPEALGTVNTTTRNNQFNAVNATTSGGSSVVVWEDDFREAGGVLPSDIDLRAQRYNSFGSKVGPEIVVAFSGLNETSPSVAINDLGQFVVSYTQSIAGDTNVVAQRFDANGDAVGGLIQVGAGTFAETDSHVAIDRLGNFTVSYTRNTNNNNPDIFAKQYNSGGQLLRVIDVATTSVAETASSISMTPDGRFDIAWEQFFGATDHDIYLKRFDASGGLLGTSTIAFSTALDVSPSVSVDNAGNAVVAWDKAFDIKARRVSSTGVLGPELNIASGPNLDRDAKVALKPGGGGFVVAYDSTLPTFDGIRYRVAEVSAFDSVTTLDTGRGSGSVSIDFFGDYFLTYAASDGPDTNIHSRRGQLSF
jgi:hypothetical protein